MKVIKPARSLITGAILFAAAGAATASSWWGDDDWGGGYNDWPVWTPMYWADEFMGNDDDYYGGRWGGGPWNRGPWGGGAPWGGGYNYGYAPYSGYGYPAYPGYGSSYYSYPGYSYPGYSYQAPANNYGSGTAPTSQQQATPRVEDKPEVETSAPTTVPSAQ